MLNKKSKLERHEISKIEDRVQCQRCLRYHRPGKVFCGYGLMLHGITKEVKKQAEQRIGSRYIMYVPTIHDVAWEYPNGSTLWKIGKSQKLENREKDHFDAAKKKNCGQIVKLHLHGEQYQMAHARTRIHADRYGMGDLRGCS